MSSFCDTLASGYTIPVITAPEDFHLEDKQHAWHTKNVAATQLSSQQQVAMSL